MSELVSFRRSSITSKRLKASADVTSEVAEVIHKRIVAGKKECWNTSVFDDGNLHFL